MSKALPTHWPSVITLWLCGIVAAMQFSKVSLAFMALQSHYAVSAASMGWILSTVGVVGLLCGVTMGLFAPSIGYRRLLLTGLGLGTVLALVQSFLLPFPLFWATRAFEGASHLAVVVAAPTLMAASAGPGHRSVAMGLWSTFVGAAFAISAAVLPLVLAQLGLSAVFYLHATVLALAWVAVWMLVPGDAVPMGTHPRPAVAALLAQHVAIYTHWTTALPGLCFLCYTFMAVALLTFLPTLTGTDRLWMAAVLPMMSVAGTFCAGWLAQYWLSPLVLVRTAFMAVAAVALAAGVSLLAGWWLPPVALLLMFSAGVAGGSAFALIPFLNDQSALQARANGAVAQLGNLGSTLGPPTFALAMSIWGGPGLAGVGVLCACVGTGLALWGMRHYARLQS